MKNSSDIPSMKTTVTSLFAFVLGLIVLMSNSSGVGEEQGRDRTGAPGSDAPCTACHAYGGSSSATATIEVLDATTSDAVDKYVPGTEYIVQMTISGGEASSKYGMQSTVVHPDGSNAGAYVGTSANTQSLTLTVGEFENRPIVEHSSSSESNVFTATWTAPATESGNAEFYMSALEVNGNGGTNGDGYMSATLVLEEAGDNVSTLMASDPWEAPLRLGEGWTWTAPERGRLVVADVSGRVLQSVNLAKGQQDAWSASGITVASFVTDRGARESWKLAGH